MSHLHNFWCSCVGRTKLWIQTPIWVSYKCILNDHPNYVLPTHNKNCCTYYVVVFFHTPQGPTIIRCTKIMPCVTILTVLDPLLDPLLNTYHDFIFNFTWDYSQEHNYRYCQHIWLIICNLFFIWYVVVHLIMVGPHNILTHDLIHSF